MPLHRIRPTLTARRVERRNQLLNLAAVLIADDDDDEALVLALVILKLALDATRSLRYGPRGPYDAIGSQDIMSVLRDTSSDSIFQTWFRMGRPAFWSLVDLIKDDPIFQSTGRRPRRPVEHQLATFLVRFGTTTAMKGAGVMSIAEGTVYLYCERVRLAIRRLMPRFVAWPEGQAREQASNGFKDMGFPGCLGIIDGSLLPLSERPLKHGTAYFCCKGYYAVALQAVCSLSGRFIDWDLGWPGAVHDSRVFKNSVLWTEKERFFGDHEYILADKYTMRPFSLPELTDNPATSVLRTRWNQWFSRVRIGVEHAFGRLKGRFPSLGDFPGRDMDDICQTIEALLTIHNILLDLGDDAQDLDDFDGRIELEGGRALADEAGARRMERGNDDLLHATGVFRRKELVQYARNEGFIV